MTLIAQTIARLEAGKADTGLKLVAGAAEFLALKSNPPRHQQPAAYVIPGVDRARPSELVGRHRQRVDRGVAVVLALGNLADPRGQGATIAMEVVEADVQAQLIGWTPDGALSVMQLTGARTLALTDHVVWRQVDLSCPFTLKP